MRVLQRWQRQTQCAVCCSLMRTSSAPLRLSLRTWWPAPVFMRQVNTSQPQSSQPVAASVSPDLDELIKKADSGDANATYKVSQLYATGDSSLRLQPDPRQALLWLTRSAIEHSHPAAYSQLAKMYLAGRGCRRSITHAVEFMKQGAKLADAESQSMLATLYAKGLCGVEQDIEQAKRLAQAAAKQGHAQAQYQYAELLMQDDACHTQSAMHWLHLASEQQHRDAQHRFAELHLSIPHTSQADKDHALSHLHEAANASHVKAQSLLAHHLVTQGQRHKAIELLRRAADEAHLPAQALLGRLLFHKSRNESTDTAELDLNERREALQWLGCTAEAGFVESQLLMAHATQLESIKQMHAHQQKTIKTYRTYVDQVIEHVHSKSATFNQYHRRTIEQLRSKPAQSSDEHQIEPTIQQWITVYECKHDRPWMSSLQELIDAQPSASSEHSS